MREVRSGGVSLRASVNGPVRWSGQAVWAR